MKNSPHCKFWALETDTEGIYNPSGPRKTDVPRLRLSPDFHKPYIDLCTVLVFLSFQCQYLKTPQTSGQFHFPHAQLP